MARINTTRFFISLWIIFLFVSFIIIFFSFFSLNSDDAVKNEHPKILESLPSTVSSPPVTIIKEIKPSKSDLFQLSRHDSDSTGINDYFELTFFSDKSIYKEFDWVYLSEPYHVDLVIPKQIYDSINFYNKGNYNFVLNDSSFKLSKSDFAHAFLENDQVIDSLAEQIKPQMQSYNHKSIAGIVKEFINLFYYVRDDKVNFNEYPKHPIETLVEGNGDCEDTTYLAYSLIRAYGVNTALLDYSNHLALGIQTYYEDIKSDQYYYKINYESEYRYYLYFESTSNSKLGDIPDKFLSESPVLIVPYLNFEKTVSILKK